MKSEKERILKQLEGPVIIRIFDQDMKVITTIGAFKSSEHECADIAIKFASDVKKRIENVKA